MPQPTNPQELIERYLYAVGRRLPAKIRKETEKELRSLIDDLLEERCGESPPSESDAIEILTKLGTPAELAGKYIPDPFNYLIGPSYYRYYKTILAIVLASAAFGILVSSFLAILIPSDTTPWYQLLGNLFADLSIGLLAAVGAVTLVFALFERRGERLQAFTPGYEIANLPPVPKENERIPRHEPILEISISLFLLGIFFFFSDSLLVYIQDSHIIPIFSREVILNHRFLLCLAFLAGIPVELLKWIDGRYSLRLAAVVLVSNLANGLLSAYFFRLPGLINPEFQQTIETVLREKGALSPTLEAVLQHWNLFLIAVICIGLAADAGIALFRSLRSYTFGKAEILNPQL